MSDRPARKKQRRSAITWRLENLYVRPMARTGRWLRGNFCEESCSATNGARLCRRPAAARFERPEPGRISHVLIHSRCCDWSLRHSRAPGACEIDRALAEFGL